MRFEEWEPVYEHIIADFGFDRAADERARDILAALTRPFDLTRLGTVSDSTVAIAGAAPNLHSAPAVRRCQSAEVVFAASAAADILRGYDVAVDCMVTDLDKTPEIARTLTAEGIPVVVHGHGDNIPAIRTWVPSFTLANVLPTTQVAPVDPVINVGGFTDGDRAAFLADHLGANRLVFPGWDFDDPSVSPVKRRKLRWAERLLYWLEQRRGDRFPVLDGRRDTIDSVRE